MIENLIGKSRNAEVSNVTNLTIEAYNQSGLSSDAHLSKIFAELIPLFGQLSQAIKRMKAESELEEKDELRDNAVRGVFFAVQAASYQPNAAIQSAAQSVSKVLDKYGLSMISESYAVESGLVDSLLSELAKPAIQTAVAAIPGCADLVAQLQAAQADFEASSLTYEQEKGKEGQLDNATTLKNAVVKQLNARLVVYLNAMQTVDVETYGNLANTIAQIISDNNITVRKRHKKTNPEEEVS